MNITVILLAAGSSTCFGSENKLLADVGGEPIVRRTATSAMRSRASETIVVSGPDAEDIRLALTGLDVRLVRNLDHAVGMGRSIACGIGAVSKDADGAFVLPADLPGMSAEVLDRLIAVFAEHGAQRIVYPVDSEGRQRNPVLWPRSMFGALAALDGPHGGKALLATHASEAVAVSMASDTPFLDVDTIADLDFWRTRT